MKQSTAVIEVTKSVFSKHNVFFEKGMRAKDVMTDVMFEEIRQELVKGFNAGLIDLSSKQENISKYVGGLMNNHFSKSRELNGDISYEPSYRRPTDPRLKTLIALKEQFKLDEERSKLIDAEIESVTGEIEATKPKITKPVDLSVLGDEFLAKLG